MNIIEFVREALTNYPKIQEFTNNIHIDFTNDDEHPNYGLYSVGDMLLNEDILGNQTRQHNFILYAANQSYNDYDRLVNSTFLLELAYWLERYKSDVVLEVTIDNKAHTGQLKQLSSANGMMYSVINDDINNGVMYQIQIYAQYTIESEE